MTYPGNNDLSPEIRRRVRETFLQTLDLAESGSTREALLGCDFILRLDPMFEPARKLQQSLKAGGPVTDTDELRAALGPTDEDAAAGDPATSEIAPVLADLGSIEIDLTAPETKAAVTRPEATIEIGSDGEALVDAPTMRIDPIAPRSPAEPAEIELDSDPEASIDAPTMRIDPVASPPPVEPPELEIETDPEASIDAPTMKIDPIAPPPAATEEPVATIETDPEASIDLPTMKIDTVQVGEPTMRLDAAPAAPPQTDLDSESEQRVQELLSEGQAAFDAGEPQMAIDAWSRIFLIDIDHPEATARIERARKLKAEIERSLEESLHEGIQHLEAGELDQAREAFEKVLEEEPSHNEARDLLQRVERLERGEEPEEPEAAPEASTPETAAVEAAEAKEAASPAPAADAPARSAKPQMAPMQAAKETSKGPSRPFLIIGSAVLLLVLGGGWFLFSNWSRFFPNASGVDEDAFDPIVHAQELHESGQTAIAIAQLERIPDHDARYEQAQDLIEQMQGKPTGGPAAEFELDDALAERAEILSRARGALAAGDPIEAEALYAQASEIAVLQGSDADELARLERQLEPVRGQIEVFRQGEWEYALRELWQIHQAIPENKVVTDLMVDCYYNLGVRELQRGDATAAAEMFSEAVKLRPGDRQMERLSRFATTYTQRSQDLLYRIFVKYLPFR